jgi:hypothetical protein
MIGIAELMQQYGCYEKSRYSEKNVDSDETAGRYAARVE